MDAKDYQVIAAQVLKILKKDKKEQGIWDVSAAANKRDIMELQSTITESKNSLEDLLKIVLLVNYRAILHFRSERKKRIFL